MAATTNWPKHGSSQQVYLQAGFLIVGALVTWAIDNYHNKGSAFGSR